MLVYAVFCSFFALQIDESFAVNCDEAPTTTLKKICQQLSRWDEGARTHPPPAKKTLPPGIDESLSGLEIPQVAQTAFDCMAIGCLCGYLDANAAKSADDGNFCKLSNGRTVKKSLRKEYRALSDAERKRFHAALKAIKKRSGAGSFDFFASIHRDFDKAGAAHSGPAFLAWHREYIKRFEIALRLADPDVNLPYWDSALDGRIPDPKDSIIWTDDFMGTTDSAGWVTTGDFTPWKTIQGTAKIKRNLGAEGHPYNDTEIQILMAMTEIDDVLAHTAPQQSCPIRPNFYSPEYTHGNVHMFVGGDMYEQATSGNDPVFYMHHCFVDFLWELWRQLRQDRNSRETAYPLTQSACSSSYHVAGAYMHPFGPWTNIDGLSNKYTDFFYEYAPRPTCSASRTDCGSPYLFCITNRETPLCATKIKLGGKCTGLRDCELHFNCVDNYLADHPCFQGMCVAGECIPDPDFLIPDPVPTSPPPPQITTPKPMEQSETCYNTQECCSQWAKDGQCQANSGYMREYCPASCKVCIPVSYSLTDECSDRHLKCKSWAAGGQCLKNPTYMNENCRQSCNLCHKPKACARPSTVAPTLATTSRPLNPLTTPKPPPTTSLLPATTASWVKKCTSPGCNNENICCQFWANQGECRKNPIWMSCWCRVSCGVCNPSDYVYGDCSDYNTQCREWSARGECDKNPWMLENCRQSCGTCLNFAQLKQTCDANGGKARISFAKVTTQAPSPAFDHIWPAAPPARTAWGGGYSGWGPRSRGYNRPSFGWDRWGRGIASELSMPVM